MGWKHGKIDTKNKFFHFSCIMYINNKITYNYECKYKRWSFVVWTKFSALHQLLFTRPYNLKILFKSLLLEFYFLMHIFQQDCVCWPWVVIVSIQNVFSKKIYCSTMFFRFFGWWWTCLTSTYTTRKYLQLKFP